MFTFKTPVKKTMYAAPRKERIRFSKVEHEFPQLSEEWRKYLWRKPVEVVYETKLEAFKSQLSEEEKSLNEKEITQRYPYWEKKIYYFHTEGWLTFHKERNGYYLMKHVEGWSSDILFVCYQCLEEKHILEFKYSWTRSGASKKPRRRCKICNEKRRERRQKMREKRVI